MSAGSVLPLDVAKPRDYFEHPREETVARLPRPLGRTLDVGCGAGGVGRTLRAAGAGPMVGMELDPEAAARAREVFDEVIEGDVEASVARLADGPRFDTIITYDILEHLVDPGRVLRLLRTLAADGGHLHISLPNARNWQLARDLLVHGTFGYTEHGHRDATHLRWFTSADIARLATESGWHVEEIETNALPPGRAMVNRLTRGYAREVIAYQWWVLCRAA